MGDLVAEELDRERWASLSKMITAWSTATELMRVLDSAPEHPSEAGDEWQPAPEPTNARLLAGALADRAVLRYDAARSLWSAARTPRRTARRVRDVEGGGWLVEQPSVEATSVTIEAPPNGRLTASGIELASRSPIQPLLAKVAEICPVDAGRG